MHCFSACTENHSERLMVLKITGDHRKTAEVMERSHPALSAETLRDI